MIRPSSLPMLAQCSAFESSGGEFAALGSQRHAALRAHFGGDDALLDALDEESQAGIRWAAEYIRCHAPMADHAIAWETQRSFVAPDFSDISGTPDATCGDHLFDLKWRRRDYDAQMAAYALMLLEARPGATITAHLLFGEPQHAQRLTFDRASAERIVGSILDACREPKPSPCDYCGWCAKRLSCPALVEPAKRIAHGYTDGSLNILAWHPHVMESAEEIDTALTIARVVTKWCESVEHHAKEAVLKRGLALPNYELKERSGRQFVADVKRAYELLKLPADDFLRACDVRLNTSKTTEKIGLDSLVAAAEGLKQAPAKREVERRLADVIQRGKPTVALVAKREQEI